MPVQTRSQKRANENNMSDNTTPTQSNVLPPPPAPQEDPTVPYLVIPLPGLMIDGISVSSEDGDDYGSDDSDYEPEYDSDTDNDNDSDTDNETNNENNVHNSKGNKRPLSPLLKTTEGKRNFKKLKYFYDKDDMKYYKSLDDSKRELIDNIETDISTINKVNIP